MKQTGIGFIQLFVTILAVFIGLKVAKATEEPATVTVVEAPTYAVPVNPPTAAIVVIEVSPVPVIPTAAPIVVPTPTFAGFSSYPFERYVVLCTDATVYAAPLQAKELVLMTLYTDMAVPLEKTEGEWAKLYHYAIGNAAEGWILKSTFCE